MIKKVFIALILFCFLDNIYAEKLSGYIITNDADTIFGKIRVSRFNLYTGGYVVNDINLEPFSHMVEFKENGKHRFMIYSPGEIAGFYFLKGSVEYRFKSFTIQTNSIIRNDREITKFLHLVFQGELSIYRDLFRSSVSVGSEHFNRTMLFYDYYLFNEKQGLNKVNWKNEDLTIIDLLKLYEVDNNYIENLSTEIYFMNIQELMYDYERWKAL